MTFIADNGHLRVMRGVVKGVFLLRVLASGGMALEARTSPEGVAQMGGFLKLPTKHATVSRAASTLMIILSLTVAPIWQSMHLTFFAPSRLWAAARVTRLPCTGWNSVNFFSCRWQAVQNVLFSSKWSVTTMPPPNATAPSRGAPPGGGVASVVFYASRASCGASGGLLHAYLHRVRKPETSGRGPITTRGLFVLPALHLIRLSGAIQKRRGNRIFARSRGSLQHIGHA